MSDCDQILEALSGGTASPAVTAHLEGCAGCRASKAALDLLVATRSEPSPTRLLGFAARTRAASSLSTARSLRLSSLRTGLLAGVLAAGGAASIGFALDLAFPRTQTAPVAAAAPRAIAPVEESVPAEEEQALSAERDELDADLTDPLDGLSADELSRLEELLDPDDNRDG